MQYQDFRRRIVETLPVGTALSNPGGGTSIIVAYTEHNITYQRRNSKIQVSFKDLYDAFNTFRGKILDSAALRGHNPQAFDSKRHGHSCNCTFFCMVLKTIGIVDRIEGAGKRGNPFRVVIPENTDL